MPFSKGYRADSKDYGYRPHHHLVGAVAPMLPKPDHSTYRSGFIWQDGVSMCTGEALKFCIQLWCAIHGYGREVLASGLWNYVVGRAQEDAGVDPDTLGPLQDVGAEPGLVLLGTRNVGLLIEADYPGPESSGYDPAKVNARPTAGDLLKAYDARGLEGFNIVPTGAQKWRDAIGAVMVRGTPVEVAMFVDGSYEANTGQVVKDINENDPDGGGHMQGILDASDPDTVLIANWWRHDGLGIVWGDANGNVRMTWDCFDKHAQQVLGITGVPLIGKAA